MGTWASVKNRAARDFTTAETALVFKTNPRLFAYLGIAMMGRGGGYILQSSHTILEDVPMANIVAYVEEVRRMAGVE